MTNFTPEKCKQIALARLDVVHQWLEFRKQSQNKLQADYDFVKLYNTSNSHLFEILGKVSRGSLHRWFAMLNGMEDYTKLLPQYKYSNVDEYRTVLNDDEIKIFMGLLLHPNRLSIGKAITLTKYRLNEQGQCFIPADITFRRYAKWFKDNNYDKWILARDGEKALSDKVEPYIKRNASLLEVGDILVADGHKLAFQVINPLTGSNHIYTREEVGQMNSSEFAKHEKEIDAQTRAFNGTMPTNGDLQREAMTDDGVATVRGYSEGLLIGRSGYIISSELLFPLGPRYIKGKKNKEQLIPFSGNYLKGFIFADHAGIFPYKGTGTGSEGYNQNDFLMSLGFGFRINLPGSASLRIAWGFPLMRNNHEEVNKCGRFHIELSLSPDFDALVKLRHPKNVEKVQIEDTVKIVEKKHPIETKRTVIKTLTPEQKRRLSYNQ